MFATELEKQGITSNYRFSSIMGEDGGGNNYLDKPSMLVEKDQ